MKCYLCLYQDDDNLTVLKESSLREIDEHTTNFKSSTAIRDFYHDSILNVKYRRESIRIVTDKSDDKRTKISVLYQDEKKYLDDESLLFEISTKLFFPDFQPVVSSLNYQGESLEKHRNWKTLKNITTIQLSDYNRREYVKLENIIKSPKVSIEEKNKAVTEQKKLLPNILPKRIYEAISNKLIFDVPETFRRLYKEKPYYNEKITTSKLLQDLQTDFMHNIESEINTDRGYFWARKIYSKIKSHEKKNHIDIYAIEEQEEQPVLLDDFIREEQPIREDIIAENHGVEKIIQEFPEDTTKMKVKKYEEEL